MSNSINRQFKLAKRPVGMVKRSDFDFSEAPMPSAGDGEGVTFRSIRRCAAG